MTEKLQLPNPASKKREHEKWEAMVDCVIEFISASRTMLYVLNERILDNEKFKEEESKRLEDEETKLAFYKECLHLEIKPRSEQRSAAVGPNRIQATYHIRERGDAPAKIDNESPPLAVHTVEDKTVMKPETGAPKIEDDTESQASRIQDHIQKTSNFLDESVQIVKNLTDKIYETDLSSRVKCKKCDITCKDRANKICEIPKRCTSEKLNRTEGSKNNHSLPSHNIESTSFTQNGLNKTSCSHNQCKLKKCQQASVQEGVNGVSSILKDTQALFDNQSNLKTSLPPSREISPHHGGNPLIKCQKASKIPRTKSYVDDKNRSTLIERVPGEEAHMGKPHCSKRCHRESTYSNIHQQRNRSPTGDNIAQS